MAKFTNSNILSVFRKQMGISKADETAFVEAFQSIFEEALLRDKILKIGGLGTFKLIPVESRKSVNINTGEEIEIAGHYKLTFTPDTSLKDKVNEPLAHLETVELDADVLEIPTVEMQNIVSLKIEQSADYFALQEEKEQLQDDPLQKLANQALELKDILADIQGLSVVESVLSDESDSSDLSNQSGSSDNSNQSAQSTPIQETPKQPEPISARDVIAELNREDIAPISNKSKFWIWIAVILGLSIIGLLVYQNRDFFVSSEEVVEILEKAVVVEESSEVSEIDFSDASDASDASDTSDTSDPSDMSDMSDSSDFSNNPLYSDKFSDIFNIKREYTEFIDTVTLNEGSRLTWISLKQYGHRDYWVYIYEANRDIVKNPNAIKIGTKLRIPKLAPELIDATNPETIEYARYLHDIYVKK